MKYLGLNLIIYVNYYYAKTEKTPIKEIEVTQNNRDLTCSLNG